MKASVSQSGKRNKGEKNGGAKRPADLLLAWYDTHRRDLPWRAKRGRRADSYRVFLSEIMLQQTTVAAVIPYFHKFVARWPDVASLAAASLDEVRGMWAGLGYYRRAQNLLLCAQEVVTRYDGVFPHDEATLRTLPGLGPYTAAALCAIAFDGRASAVDGNVERVVARLFAVQTPLPQARKELRVLAEDLLPTARFGDYAQALMDLGSGICTPRAPKCDFCPLLSRCAAKKQGISAILPLRQPKKAKVIRRGIVFVAFNGRGDVFLRQRPESGLLAGLWEAPGTPWEAGPMPKWQPALAFSPFSGPWTLLSAPVHHTFTHFDLELGVAIATIRGRGRSAQGWMSIASLGTAALPSVMRKVLCAARAAYEGVEK